MSRFGDIVVLANIGVIPSTSAKKKSALLRSKILLERSRLDVANTIEYPCRVPLLGGGFVLGLV